MKLALLAAVAADAVLADPRRGHPVAGFGTLAGRLERTVWRDSRAAGICYAAASVGLPVILARRARGRTALVAATWACLGGESLARVAGTIGSQLVAGDVDGARSALPALVGRDPASLDAEGVARAVVESVAENTSDAAVAPLFWAAVAGVPGVVGYRCVNTLDAMVGHRTDRYARFGWASARLDDLANLAPARLTAALACVLAPVVGGSASTAWKAWRTTASGHPSPNAGPCEAAFAGALGLQLGGTTVYAGVPDPRPLLGSGRPPTAGDVTRAVTLSRVIVWTTAVLLALR